MAASFITNGSLLINGIVTNIRYFDPSNTPFYVTKRLESLLIEIANFNYFDPLYHYIEQEYGIDPVSLAKYRKGRGSFVQRKDPYFDPLFHLQNYEKVD